MNCNRCYNKNIIKYGKTKSGNQMFYCKNCEKRFMNKKDNLHYDSKIIVFSLDLYFNGLSLRSVARSINDHFDLNMDHSTVYYWIKKYIPQIRDAMEDMIVNNNFTRLHVDEVFVRLRGTNHVNNMGYLWNIIDSKTRFLLASEVTKDRSTVHAKRIIRNVTRQLKNTPDLIVTDKYKGYYPAIKKLNLPHSADKRENNMVERLNGTMRARIKTQRGWKSEHTLTPAGFYLNYNFVRPHMSLDGYTPAQEMNIMKKRLTWYDLYQLGTVCE